MAGQSRAIGQRMESLAAQELERLGYRILERNWHGGGGEIDLIALDGPTLAFIEVRARAIDHEVSPEESLRRSKKARLYKAAQAYILEHNEYEDDVRLDFVAIDLSRSGRVLDLRLHKGIEWR